MSQPWQSRRVANRSDETDYSITTSLQEKIHDTNLADEILNLREPAAVNLKNFLRSNTVVSTKSSLAEKQEEAQLSKKLHPFEEIGGGSCGKIFDRSGQGVVFKRQIIDYVAGRPETHTLSIDYQNHVAIYAAFVKAGISDVSVPKPLTYYDPVVPDSTWWDDNRMRFPEGFQTPAPLIESERILPLQLDIRTAIIDRFCKADRDVIEKSRNSKLNKACLIAPELGRRRGPQGADDHMRPYPGVLNLRNFKLQVDQMETLEMDVMALCKTFAQALAIMHYGARIDTSDVEFLWGSRPTPMMDRYRIDEGTTQSYRNLTGTIDYAGADKDFRNREVQLWLLDFNMCRFFDLQQGRTQQLQQAVRGFLDNRVKYWPRPRYGTEENEADNGYWNHFKNEYIEYAKKYKEPEAESPGKKKLQLDPSEFMAAIENHFHSQRSTLLQQQSGS